MDFLLIAFLTLLNGVFAMSELAIASSRKARLAAMEESGDSGAGAAIRLMDRPTQFLSTVQVGITSIGMLNGIVGEAAFSGPVAEWLEGFGMSTGAASIAATALVVTVITFTTIIFGELVPKRIGQMFPETVARWIAQPMTWLATAAKPFVALLSLCTQAVLKLLRIDESHGRAVTEEEISASLEEGVDAGLIEEHEHQMVRNVFHLDDRSLSSLMVPRSDIEWLDARATVAEALAWQQVGADAVCASGLEGGGHRGSFLDLSSASQIGTLALVPACVDALRIAVVAAGGVMDGRGIAAAQALGAQAVQMGTAFLACPESAIGPAQRAAMASAQGRADYLSLWAGQGVGLARALPAQQLLALLAQEWRAAGRNLSF
jgi:hypothetical protein